METNERFNVRTPVGKMASLTFEDIRTLFGMDIVLPRFRIGDRFRSTESGPWQTVDEIWLSVEINPICDGCERPREPRKPEWCYGMGGGYLQESALQTRIKES